MTKETIYIGADHAGFAMKNMLREHLDDRGFVVDDLGAHTLDPNDDYPQYAAAIAIAVREHPGSFGVLSCGNAEGVCIAANKFDGIRAAVGFSIDAARTTRQDDDANVLCIPGRLKTVDSPIAIVHTFLETAFSGAKRHVRRLSEVAKIESQE